MWRASLLLPILLLTLPGVSGLGRDVPASRFIVAAEDGEAVYATGCSGCHGPDGAGTPSGPSLRALLPTNESQAGIARIVREGYGEMDAQASISSAETEAVAAFVASRFGTSGSVSEGDALYRSLCADCHGAEGGGGSGPALVQLPSAMVVSAIRSGRVGMPAYEPESLSDAQVASLAAFTVQLTSSSTTATDVRILDWSLRVVHVLAIVIYLGGGILFHGPLRSGLKLIPPGQAAMVGTHVGRGFTYLSWLSLGLWGVTGYWMVFRYGWGDLAAPLTLFLDPARLGTTRGVSLLVMLCAWYLIVISASIITFVLRPRLARRVGADAPKETADQLLDTIARSARWVDILARFNLVLTFVGLASGAPFL